MIYVLSLQNRLLLEVVYGGCSLAGRTSDCGSEDHGFESHLPPLIILRDNSVVRNRGSYP